MTTSIELTDDTWNPITGCSVTSPGCTNCYAMRQAWRFQKLPNVPQYKDTVQMTRGGPVWTGKIGIASDSVLTQPLRRKKPTMYFVNSMSDLFHENVPDEVIDRIFAVMALCPQHTFQVLTKRADRMREYMAGSHRRIMEIVCDMACEKRLNLILVAAPDTEKLAPKGTKIRLWEWPLPNVWLGVSVEDQTRADERIPLLLDTPAAVRFVSAEPLLGAVDISPWVHNPVCRAFDPEVCTCDPDDVYPSIDWVIVGGESGPNARPMHPDWARSLRDQCVDAGVPFFFKQWGEWKSISQMPNGEHRKLYKSNRKAKDYEDQDSLDDLNGETCTVKTKCLQLDGNHTDPDLINSWGVGAMLAFQIGKKAAGRLLDGRVWDEMPKKYQLNTVPL